MVAGPVNATQLLTPGLRANFKQTYEQMYKASRGRLSGAMDFITSDKLFEIYGYYQASPNPSRWDRGSIITSKAFKSVQYKTYNKDWGLRIPWHENDEEDDQIDGLLQRAREGGQKFALLDERIFFQLIQSGTDAELLKQIPTAPDGAALYATTAGGANRFGVSSGNLLTGDSSPTGQDLRDSIFEAVAQWVQMLDTESQPLIDPAVIDQGIVVYYSPTINQEVARAFQQAFPIEVDGTAGSANAAAAPSNVIHDAGLKIDLRQTVRVTTNDLYCFLPGINLRPVFKQTRRPLRAVGPITMDNSDSMRDTKNRYMQWDERAGYGFNLPYATIKVNNS